MTVYVDQQRPDGWCHMMATTREELHDLADKIGLKRARFQNHPEHAHYDLRPRMREDAVLAGAVETTSKAMLRKLVRPNAR